MAATYFTDFEIQSGQVPSPQSDIPLILPILDGLSQLRTEGNGGRVKSMFFYDARPKNTAMNVDFDFELVDDSYDPTAGSAEMWVSQPTADTGEVCRLTYGDAGISTDGSSSDIWDAQDYRLVLHFGIPSALDVTDASSYINDGTASGSPAAVTGQLGGAISLNGSSKYVSVTSASSLDLTPTSTISFWGYLRTPGAGYHGLYGKRLGVATDSNYGLNFNSGTDGVSLYYYDPVGTAFRILTMSYATDLSPFEGQWAKFSAISKGNGGNTDLALYINETLIASGTFTGHPATSTEPLVIGISYVSPMASEFTDIDFDEFRVSANYLSNDFRTTEYNNQLDPTSGTDFWSIGADTAIGTNVTVNVSGVSATGTIGNVTVHGGATVSCTGTSASSFVGSVVCHGGATVSATGVSVTGHIGNVTVFATTPGGVTVHVRGVQARGYIGILESPLVLDDDYERGYLNDRLGGF